MGITKTALFTAEQNQMASLLKAIAHPARIAIIEFLLRTDACICGDIVNELPLAQPTISQHLKELKNAGLIKGNITGNAVCYCLEKKTFAQLQNYFTNFTQTLENQDQCC